MRLGYFAMPVHPLHRDWGETLREDREAVILADELGFHDAFIGEHLTDRAEAITNSLQFQATLIHATKTIKLGSGTSNLSQMHPVLIACHAAMFDHLSEGRFIFGISPGTLPTDGEALGLDEEDKNRLFAEAIDVILEIWKRDPPYDIALEGNRFVVSTGKNMHLETGVGYLPKPFQKPHPEIVGTVVAPFSKGVVAMGRRNFHPLSANFLLVKWLKSHWDNYAQGKKEGGEAANPADWRVARTLFVADDDKTAAAYAREASQSPYRFYYRQLFKKLARRNRHGVFKEHMDQPDETLTEDYLLDKLVIHGSPSKVADEILAMREECGDFGELVYAAVDWTDPRLARRSMQLLAEKVMPRVNEAIDSGTARKDALASRSTGRRPPPLARCDHIG
jgi:alkanesulfonate monooxygenase SsuD/methylene tetrahydromethanopterin reductase-like flavin-dependent oxidoreductase (luciferase family)